LKKPFRPREQNKIYRDRYEALRGPSLWECPVCHRGRMIVIWAIAGGKYIWPRSIALLRFPTCPVPPECGVLAQRIRFAHVSNQVANFRGHVWSARTPS
jgi:hypothetical protein